MKKMNFGSVLKLALMFLATGNCLLTSCSGGTGTEPSQTGNTDETTKADRKKERLEDTSMGYFSIMPPADKFLEMVENPDKWEKTLELIDAMGTSCGHFTNYYTDDEMKRIFAFMNENGIKLTTEGPAVKEWGRDTGDWSKMGGNTAEKVFKSQVEAWRRIAKNGGVIDSMAFDEPLYNILTYPIGAGNEYKDLKPKERASDYPRETYEALFRYAARETAKFMKLVRAEIPGIKLGDIEVHWSSFEVDDIIYWIDVLNEECEKIGTPRPDFFRLDVNWAVYEIHYKDRYEGWREVKKIEEYCKSINLPFSLIYWSSDLHFRPDGAVYKGSPNPKWSEYAGGWYDGVMQQGADCAHTGINPDQIIIETWCKDEKNNWLPYETIPETKDYTFTKSVVDFYEAYMK